MTTTLSIGGNLSETCPVPMSWQDWMQLNAPLDYRATGGEASAQLITTPSQSLLGGVMLAAVASTGMASTTGWDTLVGTGGTADYLIKQGRQNTTSLGSLGSLITEITELASGTKTEPDEKTKVLEAADLVAEIKSTLGINVTDLAAIMKVSRQSIYDWLGDGQVNDANYARLLELRKICLAWRSMAKKSAGRLLQIKNADGRSLLDLLRQDALDSAAIRTQLEALAAKAGERDVQQRERTARLAPLREKDQRENALTHVLPAVDS